MKGLSVAQLKALREKIGANRDTIEKEKRAEIESIEKQMDDLDYGKRAQAKRTQMAECDRKIEETQSRKQHLGDQKAEVMKKRATHESDISVLDARLKAADERLAAANKNFTQATTGSEQGANRKALFESMGLGVWKGNGADHDRVRSAVKREKETAQSELQAVTKERNAKDRQREQEQANEEALTKEQEIASGEIRDLRQEKTRHEADAILYESVARTMNRKDKEVTPEIQNERAPTVEKLRAHRERLQVTKATTLATVTPCTDPHRGAHQCNGSGKTHNIETDRLMAALAQELHQWVNDARSSQTMRNILGLEAPPADDGQGMLGVVLCIDPSDQSLRILYGFSGSRLSPNKSEGNAIWCPKFYEYQNFADQKMSKSDMKRDYESVYPEQADKAGKVGDCAAPRMLCAASLSGLVPFRMAEIIFEPETAANHGKCAESCRECTRNLGFWLCGLEEKQSPLQHVFKKLESAAAPANFS